jgi:hypothetical protein
LFQKHGIERGFTMKAPKKVKSHAVLAAALALFSLAASAQSASKTMPLAEARAGIDAVVGDSKRMQAVMPRLSADDQVAFLADVNAAIAKMPGSVESRTAASLNANSAALRGAAKGNTLRLLAEVYATATPEALTVINERFASDLFSRTANPARPFSDTEYLYIASNAFGQVAQRTKGLDDAAVRNAFAILMFVRASNGSPANLRDALLAQMPEKATRELAAKEWLPAALAAKPDYSPMLAYANAGEQPNVLVAMRVAGPQILAAMLSDLQMGAVDPAGRTSTPLLDRAVRNFGEAQVNYPDPEKLIGFGEEPRMYQWQKH